MKPSLTWILKPFNELNLPSYHAIVQLRESVFVVEQNCIYLDCDGKDPHCDHLMGWQGERLLAYARLVPPGLSFKTASIGRVVTHPDCRKFGFGRSLMEEAVKLTVSQGHESITIGAQTYLIRFYQSFGFELFGGHYLEDGIEHVDMKWCLGR